MVDAKTSFKALVHEAVRTAPLPVNDDTLAGLRMVWCAEGAARDLRELGDVATASQYEAMAEVGRALLEKATVDHAAKLRARPKP